MVRRLYFELLLKSPQIVSVDVGNSPVVKVRVSPMQKLIALARHRLRGSGRIRFCRPNKQVNEMLTPLVNQSCYGVVIEIIKAPSNQRKAFARKVHHGSRKIQLSIKPRFDSVLIGGWYVCEMISHKRTHMTGDKLRREELVGTRLL